MTVKVEGVDVSLGGVAYVLPPIPLVKLPKIKALMSVSADMTDEFVAALIDAITWSLQRNYKDLTRETVEESIDMKNWQEILQAFMKANGFEKTEAQSGEVVAADLTT